MQAGCHGAWDAGGTGLRRAVAGGTLCGMANPFLGLAHRRPEVDMDEAARLLLAGGGGSASRTQLGSHQDRSYLVEGDDGRFVLEIARHGITRPELEAENAASRTSRPPACRSRSRSPCRTGRIADRRGDDRRRRDPRPPPRDVHRGRAARRRVVLLAASFVRSSHGAELALASLASTTGPDRRSSGISARRGLLRALAPVASTPERRALLDASIARAMTGPGAAVRELRVQVVHADITDQNTLGTRDAAGRLVPSGIIDFGDLSRTGSCRTSP